jgi:hypothetical protein
MTIRLAPRHSIARLACPGPEAGCSAKQSASGATTFTRMQEKLPELSTTPPREGRASPYTINAATMRLCGADRPAPPHSIAPLACPGPEAGCSAKQSASGATTFARMQERPPELSSAPPREGRASPYTINAATMRLCGADRPAPPSHPAALRQSRATRDLIPQPVRDTFWRRDPDCMASVWQDTPLSGTGGSSQRAHLKQRVCPRGTCGGAS